MQLPMQLIVLLALFPVLLTAGCGDMKKAKTNNEEVYQEYGKPGSPNGDSCYVGPSKGPHTCADVLNGDTAGLKTLNLYCRKSNGQRARGACKKEGLVGTCRYMKDALTLKMRFYNQTWEEAKSVCDDEAGILDRYW